MDQRISFSLDTSISLRLAFGLECSVCKREMRLVGNRLKLLQQLYAPDPDTRTKTCCCCLLRASQDLLQDSDYLERWHNWFRIERCPVCHEVFGPIATREREQRVNRTEKRSGPERYFICCSCWQFVDPSLHLSTGYRNRWIRHYGSV